MTNYRRLIEQRMEQFKDIERENKTKPHSKQGLIAEDKMDPREKEKMEAIEWLNVIFVIKLRLTFSAKFDISKTRLTGRRQRSKRYLLSIRVESARKEKKMRKRVKKKYFWVFYVMFIFSWKT